MAFKMEKILLSSLEFKIISKRNEHKPSQGNMREPYVITKL